MTNSPRCAIARVVLVLALGFFHHSVSAATLDVSAAGRNLHLPIPDGYCALDPRVSWDREAMDIMEKINQKEMRMLAMFAICSELNDMRNGTADAFKDYGVYGTPLPEATLPGVSRQEFVKEGASSFTNFDWETLSKDLSRRFKDVFKEHGVDAPSGQLEVEGGLLDKDDMALYVGLAGSATGSSIAGVYSGTLVQEVPIFLYRYLPLKGLDTYKELLARSRRLVRELIATN